MPGREIGDKDKALQREILSRALIDFMADFGICLSDVSREIKERSR
jgi:hypothetical protein